MNSLPSAWYAEGLRWIASLFKGAADYLDKPSIAPAPLEPGPANLPVEEHLLDVRHRMTTRL
ncbi:MAG: hypothetical protein ABIQ72_01210 [Usitatibacter sp.]